MTGKQSIGLALILLGLLFVIGGILGRTGSTLAGLVYGPSVLKEGG